MTFRTPCSVVFSSPSIPGIRIILLGVPTNVPRPDTGKIHHAMHGMMHSPHLNMALKDTCPVNQDKKAYRRHEFETRAGHVISAAISRSLLLFTIYMS